MKIDDNVDRSQVTFAPNLTAPPATGPDAVDCGVPQAEPGVKKVPRLSVGAFAAAKVDASEKLGPAHVNAKAETEAEAVGPEPVPS